MHRLGRRLCTELRRAGRRWADGQFGRTVVARSGVVATLILLFLAYSIGTAPQALDDGVRSPEGIGYEREAPADAAVGEGGGAATEGNASSEAESDEASPRPAAASGSTSALRPLEGKTIVIDAGHGGWDPGAIGVSGRTRESYNTLFVAQDLAQLLERAGAKVVMTRATDTFVSLDSRVAIANNAGADAFISIHNDSNPNPNIRGVTTYYYTAQSRRLADTIQAALVSRLGARNVGVLQRSFAVVRGPWMPAVLVELGFLTNWTDEQLLADPTY